MKTLINNKELTQFGCLKYNRFVVTFTKGLDIESWRITKFNFNADENKLYFTIPLCVGENPDDIINESKDCTNSINLKISYLDTIGQIVYEKEFNDYYISSVYWDIMGDYTIDEPISIKLILSKKGIASLPCGRIY